MTLFCVKIVTRRGIIELRGGKEKRNRKRPNETQGKKRKGEKMVIDNSVAEIIMTDLEDVKEQIKNDMISGDYVKWSFIDPNNSKVREISTCVSASDYIIFILGLDASVPIKYMGCATLVYRCGMSAKGNDYTLLGVQR